MSLTFSAAFIVTGRKLLSKKSDYNLTTKYFLQKERLNMQNDINSSELRKKKTEQLLGEITNLPSIPKVIFHVTKLLDDPRTAANRLSDVIIKDQGLTTKLLSVANSPLFGLKQKISSIDYAILILGFNEVKNIVTTLSLAESLQLLPDKNFDVRDFWKHSMVVGSAAKAISGDLGFDFSSDAFTAGVLHDVGIQVIYKFMKSDFNQIVEKSRVENKIIIESEREVLGISHQEAGAFLASKWNLPPLLCYALNNHHNPGNAENNKFFCAVIHLADYMTQKLGIGSFYWDEGLTLDPAILELLNFRSEEVLDDFIMEYEDLFRTTFDLITV